MELAKERGVLSADPMAPPANVIAPVPNEPLLPALSIPLANVVPPE